MQHQLNHYRKFLMIFYSHQKFNWMKCINPTLMI